MTTIVWHISDLHIRQANIDDLLYAATQLKARIDEESTTHNVKSVDFINDVRGVGCPHHVVVIAGDIFDSLEVKSAEIDCLNAILDKLTPIPIIMIPGNHDFNKNVDNPPDMINDFIKDRPDFKDRIRYQPRIRAGTIPGFPEIKWHLRSPADKSGRKTELMPPPSINIAIMHESISESNVQSLDAMNFDIIMLGDHHQYKAFRPHIAYSGSFIQHKRGEGIEHGVIRWEIKHTPDEGDVEGMGVCGGVPPISHKFIPLRMNCGHVQVAVVDSLDGVDIVPSVAQIRERVNDIISIEIERTATTTDQMLNDAKLLIQHELKISPEISAPPQIGRQPINPADPIEESLANIVDDEYKTAILQFHQRIMSEVVGHAHIYPNIDFNFLYWSNAFCYGTANFIDFKSMNGLYHLIGNNGIGKSSVLNILLAALFDDSSRFDSKKGIVRNGEKEAVLSCGFTVHDGSDAGDYIVKRIISATACEKVELYKCECASQDAGARGCASQGCASQDAGARGCASQGCASLGYTNITSPTARNTNAFIESLIDERTICQLFVMMQRRPLFMEKPRMDKLKDITAFLGCADFEEIHNAINTLKRGFAAKVAAFPASVNEADMKLEIPADLDELLVAAKTEMGIIEMKINRDYNKSNIVEYETRLVGLNVEAESAEDAEKKLAEVRQRIKDLTALREDELRPIHSAESTNEDDADSADVFTITKAVARLTAVQTIISTNVTGDIAIELDCELCSIIDQLSQYKLVKIKTSGADGSSEAPPRARSERSGEMMLAMRQMIKQRESAVSQYDEPLKEQTKLKEKLKEFIRIALIIRRHYSQRDTMLQIAAIKKTISNYEHLVKVRENKRLMELRKDDEYRLKICELYAQHMALNRIPAQIMGIRCVAINAKMQEIADKVVRFSVGCRMHKIPDKTGGETCTIKLYINDMDAKQASGYQKVITDLIFRLAVVELQQKGPKIMLIDEGFSEADADHRGPLADFLARLNKSVTEDANYIKRLITISHIDAFTVGQPLRITRNTITNASALIVGTISTDIRQIVTEGTPVRKANTRVKWQDEASGAAGVCGVSPADSPSKPMKGRIISMDSAPDKPINERSSIAKNIYIPYKDGTVWCKLCNVLLPLPQSTAGHSKGAAHKAKAAVLQ